ncbi:hypothetical protein ACFP2T_26725 [Plantactinospora solaniradicis]|uniref:Uncharacterized protein n=2 Tax=Plantactinospora solaniradicis TaxID=1723736 RepID=A0ABW1KEB3_9ACTN
MQVHITHEFAVRMPEGSRLPTEDLHQEGERLMEALLDLENCNEDVGDVATSSDAARGAVVAELVVTAVDEAAAVEKATTVIRSAIHTIGGSTAGWDRPSEQGADYHPKAVQLERV